MLERRSKVDCVVVHEVEIGCAGANTRVSAVAARLPRAICRAMQFKHPFTLMLPILITQCARSNCTGARAQNGAVRSKRRCALITALRVQTVLHAQNGGVRSNGAARSLRRYTLKTAVCVQTVLRAQNGATRSKRRCAFKRGSAGGRQIS